MTTSVVNNSDFRGFFEKQKLTGPNFIDWYRQLRIVLSIEDKLDYPKQPIPPAPVPAQAGQQVALEALTAHTARVKRSKEIAGLMLITMEPDIQLNFKNLGAHNMLQELKTVFAQQAEQELLQSMRDFHSCKQEEGQSVSSYALKMKSYINNLERLGHPVSLNLGVSFILISLCKEFDSFVQNYNMHIMRMMINELHAMLKLHEQTLTKKDPTLHVIRAGKVQKKNNNQKKSHSMYVVRNKRAKLNLNSALLWHCRLGHIRKKHIEKLQHDGLFNSTNLRAFEKCVSCMSGKMARKPYTHQVERAKDLLGLIHTDVCGLFRTVSRQGASNFVTFTDDFSRYGYAYLLKHKHEVFETFKVFLKKVENQLEKTIKSLCSDRGGGYMSQEFLDHLKEHGIITRCTPPYTPQHNASGSLKDLKIIQKEDTRPFIDTSLNHGEDDLEIDEPQSDIIPIRRSTKTRHAPDRMCLYIDAEEHELGDLGGPANYKAALLDPNKWLFKKKTNMDGVVHTFKARLVAKGFTQTYGVDYEETLSPVADIRAIRILIAIAVDRSRRLIGLCQSAYIEKILKRFHIENSKRRSNLIQEKLKLSKSQGASTPDELKRMQNMPYASAVGSIMYAVRCTRLDVAFTQNIASRFQQNPGDLHRTTIKNIMKYLRNTKDMFLVYEVRICILLNGGVVDWKSTKQSIFATSSTEVEYIDAYDASKEVVWVREFISWLGVVPIIEEPINMYCDNTGAITIANESRITKGARHFRVRVHYLREVIEYGNIKLEKVHTNDNLANPFTKALAFTKHSEHTRNIGMLSASSLM
uniref:Zinc finger, CCHC-type n=1 Tax=Tanacetum cinerariifolium TaxID=118510 RepID=A0A699HC04_TANCI|nr:zinc finger, CCHC-type [Tanacetum cinerariifolium]